jgi:amidase
VAQANRSGEVFNQSLVDVGRLIRSRAISPVELTTLMLERISSVDGNLHSYITVSSDLALSQARAAELEISAGDYRGPLHGIPIAVKDLCATRGVRTTCGSKIKAKWIPEYDATVISRLYSAGAVLLGKLTLTEFAGIGYHPTIPVPLNPWSANHWTGSSSSGSGVATAAGLCFAALGTDTGGSIRFPSAACGVVGLKPTYGRVSRHGVFPLGETLDHVGPMTRSVADAAVVLQAIAGFDENDPTSRRSPVPDYVKTLEGAIKGIRIGLDESFCRNGADPSVSEAIVAAASVLTSLGASVCEIDLAGVEKAAETWGLIFTAECGASHEASYPSRAADYSAPFRAFLEEAPKVRGIDYVKAHIARTRISRLIDDVLQDVDVILSPSMGIPPMPLNGKAPEEAVTPEVGNVLLRFTSPFSLTGSPTISIPCGFTKKRLPLSLQLAGTHDREDTILRVAHAYECATEWHNRRPPL